MNMQKSNAHGFTLVEVLVTLAITGLVMSSVYGVYINGLQDSNKQNSVIGIQQDQRFALDFLTQSLRIAGYDPTEAAEASIEAATATYLYFTRDWKGTAPAPADEPDGALTATEEHIAFCLYNSVEGQSLGYTSGSTADTAHTPGSIHGHQPIISSVENLEFFYRMEDGTSSLAPAVLDDIRGVTISLLVRADNPDPKYSAGGKSFTSASGAVWGPYTDNIRRRLIQTSVDFRNMGL